MNFRIEHNGTVFEYERQPMSKERFTAVCRLIVILIAATVLLAVIKMLGMFSLLVIIVVGLLAMWFRWME